VVANRASEVGAVVVAEAEAGVKTASAASAASAAVVVVAVVAAAGAVARDATNRKHPTSRITLP